MSEAPPITVYMPAYSVGKYVRAAVESILAQTFTDFEFIIIDDGSTDDTLAILRELAERDKRIRLVTRPNAGVAATANQAIAQARGEFIARMDGDDLAMPTRLEKQIAFLRDNPACVVVGSKILLIDEEGEPLFEMVDIAFGHEKIDSALLTCGWPIVQPACMFRRQTLVEVGCYRTDLSLHEDHDLFLRLAEVGRLENIPEVLLQYRQHFSSLTCKEAGTSRPVLAQILSDAYHRRGLDPMKAGARVAATRGNADPMKPFQRHRVWAWRSLKVRNVPAARKHAFAALRLAPLDKGNWKLIYCALRGR